MQHRHEFYLTGSYRDMVLTRRIDTESTALQRHGERAGRLMSFHQWISTDEPGEDQCVGCGVATPDFGEGVVSDHGPLPIFCPGPEVGLPHHFTGIPSQIQCEHCGYTVTENTMPNEVDWECLSRS